MKNEFFSIHGLNGDSLTNYIIAVKKLAENIGVLLVEDKNTDKVIAKFGNNEEISVMEGMYDFHGNYMSRWYEAQHSNLPERLVHYAITHQTAGRKRIRLAKRMFDSKYPAYFDKWRYNMDDGVRPDGWVSIV